MGPRPIIVHRTTLLLHDTPLCSTHLHPRTHDVCDSGSGPAAATPQNIWSICLPSAESGIGVGGRAKDTAFGLYRDGTELRGIYCSKPTAAVEVRQLRHIFDLFSRSFQAQGAPTCAT